MSQAKTLFDKIWDAHVVETRDDGSAILYIDRHLVHEVTSPQAFEGLRNTGRSVRRPDATLAVADHNVPTTDRSVGIADEESRIQVETLEKNCAEFGVPAGSRPRWCMSGNIDRFVPDTHAGTDCRSAVRPLRPGDSWFDGARQALSNHLSAV